MKKGFCVSIPYASKSFLVKIIQTHVSSIGILFRINKKKLIIKFIIKSDIRRKNRNKKFSGIIIRSKPDKRTDF